MAERVSASGHTRLAAVLCSLSGLEGRTPCRARKGQFSGAGQGEAEDGVCRMDAGLFLRFEHHLKRERQAQMYGSFGAFHHAGVAVPALFGVGHEDFFTDHTAEEHVGLTGFVALAAFYAQGIIDDRRHTLLLTFA